MGYIKSYAKCRCDFCLQSADLYLDEWGDSDSAIALSEMAQSVTNAIDTVGKFFKDGTIYACHDCYSRAQDNTPDDSTYEDEYEWLDDNSRQYLSAL